MPRIPTYENTTQISSQGSATYMDMAPLLQNQQAANQLGDATGELIKTVNDHFKQAANVNTLNDEDNKMMSYFFDLRDESKKQPVDQQTNYFQQKSNEYLDGLKSRVTDPKLLRATQDYWRSHTQSGMYDVQDNQRKLTISDGVAKLGEGDKIFSSQIDSWSSNPQIIEQELSKRFGAYDRAAQAGFLTPAQAQKAKEDLGNQTDYTRALIQMRDDPYQAQEDIGKHDIYANLNSQTRELLLERTDAKIKQDEAEARREAREAKMMRMSEYSLVKQDISDAAKVYDEKGAKPLQWDALMATAKHYSDLDGGRTFNRMRQVENDAATTIDFKGLSLPEMSAQLSKDVDLVNSGKANTDQIRQYQQKASIYSDMQSAARSGNQLGFMEKYHIAPVDQLNPYDADSIDKRITLVGRAKQQMGGNPNMFTDKEVGTFAKQFNEGTTKEQEALGAMFNRMAGGDATKLQSIFKQLSVKDTSIADEASFRMQGDNYTAEMMNSGRKKRENGLIKNSDKLSVQLSKAVDDMNISMFDQSGALRKQMLTGLQDIYYGMAKETNDFTSDPNSSLVDKSIERYFGGRLVTLNGGKIPPFAPGQSDYDHLTLWNSLTPDILKAGSPTGELPQVRIGSTATALPLPELLKKGRLVPFGDNYAIALPNAAEKLSGFPEMVATNSDGSTYQINMRKIVPQLLARRTALTQGAMDSFDRDMGIK